jgi:pimeloyl-ACP methyl ester carboxylesterase
MSDGTAVVDEVLAAPAPTAQGVEIYSGVARLAGTVWGRQVGARGGRPRTAILLSHPTANFFGHYALVPLARRGYAAVGMNTRYCGNDSNLRLENCLLDIGTMVTHLRHRGYERIVLVGNSGGASIVPYYQAQAESPTVSAPPGDGPDLTRVVLPPVDAMVLLMAHSGRARLITEWLDPAIVDEHQPFLRDSELDLYDKQNGPPFSEDFLVRYRAAQVVRNRNITARSKAMLTHARRGSIAGLDDVPFVVHGTYADPRSLDSAIEPSDRPIGVSLWGDPAYANYFPAGIARYTTARSWINQWSLDDSLGDSLRWLPTIQAPVHIIYGTADTAAHPTHAREMYEAARPESRSITAITGAGHYFENQPDLLAEACDDLASWLG